MLLGGEPFLHPNLIELCQIARNILPEIEIKILTNGIILNNYDTKKLKKLEELNRVIVDEFIDKIYIGKLNEETNSRDIQIKWNFE